nr:unnamed protein product [Callosobruchus chinensis]
MLRHFCSSYFVKSRIVSRRDYGEITSALKLRSEDVHSAGRFHGQLHNRTQQLNENLTMYAYKFQSSTERAFVNSPIDTQKNVPARQFVEGIADLEVQRLVSRSCTRN